MATLVKLSALKLDYDFYPRHELDSTRVQRLVEVLQVGTELPPIIIEKTASASKRVVDGFHRVRAYTRCKRSEIPAISKAYANDVEMCFDAIHLNSQHGQPLHRKDQMHCATILAGRFGIPLERVAEALVVPLNTLRGQLGKMIAIGPPERPQVYLPTAIRSIPRREFTAVQVAVIDSLPATTAPHMIQMVTNMLRTDLFDLEDDGIVTLLRELKVAVDKALMA